MLQAFHKYVQQLDHIAFVGIHTGHLGFFADWKPDELDHLASLMFSVTTPEELHVVQYPVVEIEITTEKGLKHIWHLMNLQFEESKFR